MTAEAGHHASRSYFDQDGAFHLNGAAFFNDDENDIADQLEVLDEIASADLTKIDGITNGTVAANKAVVVDGNLHQDVLKTTALYIGASGSAVQVTATAAEINTLDRTGAAGVAEASKAVVLDANKHVDEVNTASLKLGATGATVAVTATAAELNYCDVTTAGVAEASKAVVLDANKHVDEVNTASLKLGATGATVAVTATAAELNSLASSSAGLAALLASGLGASAAFAKTSAATTTLLAAHGTKDRACLVVVHVDETYDIGTGTLPTVAIGEDDTIEKCMAATVLDTEAAGTVLVYAFTNTATKKIIVTTTAAVGDATGGCTVTVLAIPTS